MKCNEIAEASVVAYKNNGTIFLAVENNLRSNNEWILDSVCSYHMCLLAIDFQHMNQLKVELS